MDWKDLVPWRAGDEKLPTQKQGMPFMALQQEMNRMFNSFFDDFPAVGGKTKLPQGIFSPSVDVEETDTEITVRMEVPGLNEGDLDIDLTDDRLVVSGEKQLENERKEKGSTYFESSYGSFRRIVPLGMEIKEDAIDASLKNGVLTILLPKAEGASKSRKTISVRAA